MPNVSNWGPANAAGIAEVVLSEDEARGPVIGLPALPSGQQYAVWLQATTSDDVMRFGPFNTDSASRGQFRFIVEREVANRNWHLLFVTVETTPAPAAPSDKRALAGYFLGPDQRGLLPKELPKTGGETPFASEITSQAAPQPAVPAAPEQQAAAPEAWSATPLAAAFAGSALALGIAFIAGYRVRGRRRATRFR